MKSRYKTSRLQLPAIVPGEWRGEVVGTASVNFGQVVQSEPARQAVEFTYIVAPVALTMPVSSFVWPGILIILAPTPMKIDYSNAGVLYSVQNLPSLSLSLGVSRVQFSEMLPHFEANRFRDFHFLLEDQAGENWPVQSWGMGIPLLESLHPSRRSG